MQVSTVAPTQPRTLQLAQKRILVLGSALHTQSVDAFAWNDLPGYLNVGDYDVIILNLVSFLEQQSNFGIRAERLPTWQQIARLLFSPNSEVICIGLPGVDANNSLYQSTSWWLPVTPEFVFNSGEVIRNIKPEFAYYFEHVRRWFFYATPSFKSHFMGLAGYLRVVHPWANNLQVGMGAIAHTRFNQAIAFKLIFRAGYVDRSRALPARRGKDAGVEPLLTSGVAVWLPPPTEISADEAISLILRERYRRAVDVATPEWVATYQLPQQQAIAAQVNERQKEIERLQQEIALAQKQLEATTSLNRLLYEQNQEALTLIVCDALRELGAQVSDAKIGADSTSSGGIMHLTDPSGREGMLLVKTRAGELPLNDLRQLDQYVRDLMLNQNWRGKGILIANTYYTHPPEQRNEPFPSNCIRAAQQLFGYCLVTTTQLFQAIATHQRKELGSREFWNAIFEVNGVCPLPELSAQEVSNS
ncbi:hypothetical protein H6F95_15775 [Cyanobacteria bacterium FACHB-471]|nr:hypothetical protein [Cyanobacteria bacterium FACHB-471]